jgi:hypothetical protein
MLVLLEFVAYVSPGGALVYFICRRVIRGRDRLVTGLRVDAVRADVKLRAAEQAALVSEEGRAEAAGTAREALARTREALAVARTIELVDEKVTSLTDYLVTRIEGEAPARRTVGRHALPGGQDVPAIHGIASREGFLP